jgi:hypothetical protein
VTAPAAQPRLVETAVEILQGIHQHRLLSTSQVHALHAPHAHISWPQRLLAQLRDFGLIHMTRLPRRPALWHVTDQGADAVEAIGDRIETRRKVLAPDAAVGALQAHTLAVNDVGVAFVRAARERGDECSPFAWRNEIAHPLGPPPGRRRAEQLISDAVLRYQHNTGGQPRFLYRFVEVDRATRATDDLAERIARYGRLHRHTVPGPAGRSVKLWPKLYPTFPAVLLVLAGRRRDLLERRRDTVLGLCARHPDLASAPEVEIQACLFDDLTERGPFAPIFRTPADPGRPADWLGNASGERDDG